MKLEKLSLDNKEQIKRLFQTVFMGEPWNDDWSDEKQLDRYIIDLIGNPNLLTLGLIEKDKYIGMSLGSIRHWYSGTEYYIEEFFVLPELQGKGIGSEFINLMEEYLKEIDIHTIFLQTDNHMPAYSFYKKKNFVELKEHISFVKKF